jgi:FkbM family methyltransferase
MHSLKQYWPIARSLSTNYFEALILFIVLLSIPIRKRLFGRGPKKIHITVNGQKIPFFVRDGMDLSVLHEMFVVKEYNFPEIKNYHPQHIADIGGHIGVATLVLRAMYPKAKVTIYEPDADNFKVLVKNVGSLENVHCVNAAVGDKTGKVLFYSNADASTRASVISPGGTIGNEIASISFKDVMAQGIDFVKFDPEGDEYSMFISVSPEILKQAMAYVGEVHFDLINKTKQEFEALFPGFSFVWTDSLVAILRT